jgi:CMP-N-acetylneuraminic acid synthetase
MKDDGFYYCNGILFAKVGDNILELTFESGNTYISFMVEQETTNEQKYTALKNIGFVYETQSEYNIYPTNGIIYIEDSQTLFIVKDGILSKYTAPIPNPFTE